MMFARKMKLAEIENRGNQIKLIYSFFYSFIGNIFLLIAIFSLSISIVLMRDDFLSKQLGNFEERFYEITEEMGFVIEDIVIEGRDLSSKEEVADALSAKRGDNIIKYDLWQAKKNLEELPWVKEATVRRSYFPNVIHVFIKEKKAMALWQIDNEFYPIDSEGKIIHSAYIPGEISLLIVGKGAPEKIKDLLNVISQDEEIFSRIRAAQYISERRWNIVLDDVENGIVIKLPEEDYEKAWKKLLKLNVTEGILKRKLTFIDLRLPDKVVVKLAKDEDLSAVKVKKEHKI